MLKCEQCGGRMRRVHRTFFERFSYMAIYECRDCDAEKLYPRRYTYHFGPYCRCPHCGTLRVTRLKTPDKIDPRQTGFLNYLERLAGGKLHHCRYCRVQFYDRRMLASEDKRPTLAWQEAKAASSSTAKDPDE
jgi:DNA-directed RNA polymerase subunit RPC12/RpoP